MFSHLLAQVTYENSVGLVSQIGWPGLILYIVVTRLDRLEHTLKGLSKALWMDLASRPYTDIIIKDIARAEISKMESSGKK